MIYGLVSSEEPKKIRYVGKTHQKISKRIHDHIRESFKLKTKKDIWIQTVLNDSYNINYIIIEMCDKDAWLKREIYWIDKLNYLTNTSKGGDGGRGLLAVKSYYEIREFAHKNMINVRNSAEWIKFVNNNPQYDFLPKFPYSSYKNRGWVSWSDLLPNYGGTSNRRNAFRNIFNYDECKLFLKSYKISSSKEFKKLTKNIDSRVPSMPDIYYKKTNEWVSWMDFLNNDNIYYKKNEFLSYYDAIKNLKKLNLKSKNEYIIFIKEYNKNNALKFPTDPDRFYNKQNTWFGWGEYLSKNKTHL